MAGSKEGGQSYQLDPQVQADNRREFLWGSAQAIIAATSLQIFYKDVNRAIDKRIDQGNRAAQQAEADGYIPPSEKDLQFANDVRNDMIHILQHNPLHESTPLREAAKKQARQIYDQQTIFTTKRDENLKAIQEQEGGKPKAFFARLIGDVVASGTSVVFTAYGLIKAGAATYLQYEAVNKKAQEIGISRRDFLRGKFPDSQPPQSRPQK